jgi:DHA1 family multidrug resistance protein-like MFS transporter
LETDRSTRPPAVVPNPSRQSWILLTTLFTIASLFEIVLFGNLSAFTPLFLQNIGYDEAGVKLWTGILASAGIALGFWFVPFWGVLADRHGRKLLILRSFAIEAVAVMLMAFSQSIWIFLLARMMTGLALGNTGLMFATLADESPRERVGLAISIVTGSQPLGVVVGSLLGGLVVSRFGVNLLFGLDSVLIGLITVMLALFYKDSFVPGVVHPIKRMLGAAMSSVVGTPIVLSMFIFSFLTTLGNFFSSPFIPNRIIEVVGAADSGSAIGLVFGIAGIATIIATPLWGIAADRWGHRRLLPLVVLLTAVLYLPLYFAADIDQFTVRLFLLFAVSPAVNSLTFATIGLETPSEKRSAVMSMIYMPLNAAILFAPSLAVILTHEIREVFLYSALITFGAFVMFVLVHRSTGLAPARGSE